MQEDSNHLSVKCKLKDSLSSWNDLLLGCNPGQFSFILYAASYALPMAVNLQHLQCKLCPCGSAQPTTADVAVLPWPFYILS